jgi:hypothetical protein
MSQWQKEKKAWCTTNKSNTPLYTWSYPSCYIFLGIQPNQIFAEGIECAGHIGFIPFAVEGEVSGKCV